MFNSVMTGRGEARSVIREIFEYGNERAKLVGRENVFDFSLGNPKAPPPAGVQAEIERLLRELPAEELHGYTSAQGLACVREAIADYIVRKFSAEADAELVYLTCGAAASLCIAFNALCERGDEVIVPAPCFPEYRVFLEQAGAVMKAVGTDEKFHLDLNAIERAVTAKTRAVLINTPNNPTGAVYTREEIEGLCALLERKSAKREEPIFLVTDEPYRELCYGTESPYPAKYYPHTVTCYSFSKSLSLAGERIGYISVNPACFCAKKLYAAVCGAGRSLGYVCAPALFQRVIAKNLGVCSSLALYQENRALLYKSLTEYGFECVPPEGAFYLFMRSPEPSAEAFCERAKKYELLLVPSSSFGTEGYVRISYCVETAMIKRALPAFKKLAEEYGLSPSNRAKTAK